MVPTTLTMNHNAKPDAQMPNSVLSHKTDEKACISAGQSDAE
jgi:hypothetical protein